MPYLDRKEEVTICYQIFLFFGPIVKNKMAARNLIARIFRDWLSPATKSRYGWKIAKKTLILKTTNQPIFFETAERNLKKLDRKQELNVLYQICVYGPIKKQQDYDQASD